MYKNVLHKCLTGLKHGQYNKLFLLYRNERHILAVSIFFPLMAPSALLPCADAEFWKEELLVDFWSPMSSDYKNLRTQKRFVLFLSRQMKKSAI